MDRAYRRYKDYIKAKRKRDIDYDITYSFVFDEKYLSYDNLHQYSKNKIHCSCPMCSSKTKNKGKRRYKKGNYAPSYNPKASEIRKKDAMDYDEDSI